MGENGNGSLIVKVSRWGLFIQAWVQKLLSTVISAKVLITLLVVWVSYQLTVTQHTYQTILMGVEGEQTIHDITAPYVTGADWANLMGTVIVAFISARVMPQVVEAVGTAVGNAFVNRSGRGEKEDE